MPGKSWFPKLLFKQGVLRYRKKESVSCLEQEFKGRLAYLHYYEIVSTSNMRIQVKVSRKEIYALYVLQAESAIGLSDVSSAPIVRVNSRRAAYLYAPAGDYILHLPAGKTRLFVFYFDIGVFDDGADKDFDFLQPLLQAYRADGPLARASLDFALGPISSLYIRELCQSLKRGSLDHQISMLEQLKEIVKLSKRKVDIQYGAQKDYIYYTDLAKDLLEMEVRKNGAKFSTNVLTDVLPYTKQSLNRIFKARFRKSIRQYAVSYLVGLSQNMIRSGVPIWKVSLQFNFNDVRSFRRTFFKISGKSPQQFRNDLSGS